MLKQTDVPTVGKAVNVIYDYSEVDGSNDNIQRIEIVLINRNYEKRNYYYE